MSKPSRVVGIGILTMLVAVALAMPAQAEDYRDTQHSEVNSSASDTRAYVGSPSVVVLPNGEYLASHADFGSGTSGKTTQVFKSRNRGVAWEPVAGSPVNTMTWATIFQAGGNVYLMGVNKDTYGDAVISKSTDNGETWSTPKALLRGSYHTGDTPILIHDGRIYKTYEENLKPPGWSPGFRPLMISADLDSDLTDPQSWIRTNNVDKGSVLEGNPIVGPDGMIWNILRYNDSRTKAWVTKLDPADPKRLENAGEIEFPYGTQFSKFYILRDEVSNRYLMVGNAETSSTGAITQRNHLDLYESTDLANWNHVRTLIEDDSPGSWEESVRGRSFSQPTAQIDGDDLLVASRTAYDGAANYHDANRLTFHRYEDFRRYLDADSELAHYSFDDPAHRGADVSKASDTDADLTPETQIVKGHVGDAIRVSDTSSNFDLGNRVHPLLDGRRAITVSAWVKPDATPDGAIATVFGTRVDARAAGLDLLLNGEDVQVGGRSVGSDGYQKKIFALQDPDQWHHLTAVWDFAGDDMLLFIDGRSQEGVGDVAFGSDTYEVGNPTQTDSVGAAPGGDYDFNGSIDEVRMFATAAGDSLAMRLAGLDQTPALDDLQVDGVTVPGFNPSVHHYDVVVPQGTSSVVTAEAASGAEVDDPERSIKISDVPSEPVTFAVLRGEQSEEYAVTVRHASADTSLGGVILGTGQSRSFASADADYRVAVSQEAGRPLDLSITDATATRTWDGASAEVMTQANAEQRHPEAIIRVTAENGAAVERKVIFDVERSLVSVQADPSSGDAPVRVAFTAEPTKWAEGRLTYDWDFGDGAKGSGATPEHVYRRAGSFDATVVIEDSSGASDRATVQVRVSSADRLVGRWRFEQSDSSRVVDTSLYDNDGAATDAERVTGHYGTGHALRFAGAGGATLDEELGTDLVGAPAITISAWIRPDGSPVAGEIGNWVFGTRIGGGAAGAEVYMLGDALRVGGRSQPSDSYVRSDYLFEPDGKWHQVTAVLDYEADDIALFLDGKEQDAVSHAGSFGSRSYEYQQAGQPDSIGRSPDGAFRFTGAIDDVTVHAKSFNSKDVKAALIHDGLWSLLGWIFDGWRK